MATMTGIENLCTWTPEGKAAMDAKLKFGVQVNLKDLPKDVPPASYDRDTNACELDSKMNVWRLSSFFVHEMSHARQFKLGKTLDPSTSAQDDYVADGVADEMLATMLQMQHFLRLDLAGQLNVIKPLTLATCPPVYAEYKRSFDIGAQGGNVEEGIKRANGVVQFFINEGGIGVGSMKYKEFYWRQWKRANAPKPATQPGTTAPALTP